MKYTLPLKEVTKEDTAKAGGKGASLGELTHTDIPVPPGFVVTAQAFEQFLKKNNLTNKIESILKTIDFNTVHDVNDTSIKIQNLILSAEIPKDIKKDILSSFKTLNAEFVAVRSSATVEDGVNHAWAGQLDSYLNIREGKVVEHVQKCWASLFTPRALFYRFEKKLHTTHASVAVVVQKMVNSEKSGVAFSVHPITENRNQLIIEAGFGLGESIALGHITPDLYVVKKKERSILDSTINIQDKGLYRKTSGGNAWKKLPKDEGGRQVLTKTQILELSDIILKIEKHYEAPQDIEWAMENEEFFIVQSRPITTLNKPSSFSKDSYRQIFSSDGYSIMNAFNLVAAGYIASGGIITVENNNKVNLYIKESKLNDYGKIGYKIFSSSRNSRELVDDINKYLELIESSSKKHKNKISSYSNKELAKSFKKINKLIENFLSLYCVLEPHHTFLTEDRIKEYMNTNKELYLNHTVFDVILENNDGIKDSNVKILCQNIALLSHFKLSTKEAMGTLFKEYIKMLQEINERFELSPPFGIKILSTNEIYKYLTKGFNKKEFKKIWKERSKYFLIKSKNGTVEEISVGANAKKQIKKLVLQELSIQDGKKKKEFGGQVASKGHSTGKAIVLPYISSTEDNIYKAALDDFQQGDILITKNTVPEIIEITKKAGAIVTEEGGITCHGAVISRELGVPGIVGVRNITKYIKTGDLVEVDAINGVVKLIKKL